MEEDQMAFGGLSFRLSESAANSSPFLTDCRFAFNTVSNTAKLRILLFVWERQDIIMETSEKAF